MSALCSLQCFDIDDWVTYSKDIQPTFNPIITIIKTTSEFRNASLTVTVTAVGVSQPGADAER